MEVYAIGSQILLDGTISARVTGITIRDGGRVFYEAVYWNDRERVEIAGLEEWEISPDNDNSRKMRVDQVL